MDALAELTAMNVNDDLWMAAFSSMQENLLRHVNDEESNLFIKIRQALSATQLVELGARMKSEKDLLIRAI